MHLARVNETYAFFFLPVMNQAFLCSRPGPTSPPPLPRGIMAKKLNVSTCTLLVRRSALDEAGYFDESLCRHQ